MRKVLFLTLCLMVSHSLAADNGYYVEANISGFAMQSKRLVMPSEARDSLATEMINYLKSLPADKQIAQGPKMIAVARFLSPANRDAIVLIGQHRRKYTPYQENAGAKKDLVERLSKCAKKLIDAKHADNKTLAAYLLSLVLQIDPENQDANFIFESKKLHAKVNWENIFKNGVPKEEALSSKPGGAGSAAQTQTAGRLIKKGWANGYASKTKNFVLNQARVKGLFVTITENGYQGTAMDIIATVTLNSQMVAGSAPSTSFRTTFTNGRPIGTEMRKAADEAFSVAKGRYPIWPGSVVTYSFREKYTPKDGGSAGAAFSLLLLSLLDGIEIRRDYAITGDISVDWKVLQVGGVVAKIKGAQDADLQGVVIPMANQRAVYDMVLLGSLDDVWKIHVFEVDDLSGAIETMRADQSEARKRGLELFAKVQEYLKKKGKYGLTKSVHDALIKVQNDVPNSLSARVLAEACKGKLQHDKLSVSCSIDHLFQSCRPVMPLFIQIQLPNQGTRKTVWKADVLLSRTTETDIKNARDGMRQLRGKMPADVNTLYEKFDQLLRKVESYMRFKESAKPTSRPFVELKEIIIPKIVDEIRKEVGRLGKDEDFLKRLNQGK